MPICITCSTPVRNLYTTYSKADDRSLGKGVRLTQCPNCKRFADKYVEHDYIVLFIDLVLIKPQVYRHLLFNRLGGTDDKLNPSILRLGILLVLFDVYITWARIERSNSEIQTSSSPPKLFSDSPILTQYLFFLTLNVLATLAQHGTVRLLARYFSKQLSARSIRTNYSPVTPANGSPTKSAPIPGHSPNPVSNSDDNAVARLSSSPATTEPLDIATFAPGHASSAAISTALLVSSCSKLFPILLVIWPTDTKETVTAATANSAASFVHRATSYIGWIVLLNNIEALLILLDCGYVFAALLAVAGVLARWTVEGWLLSFVGLIRESGGYGDGPVGDVISTSAWLLSKVNS